MKPVRCIYTVKVELDETGEGYAYITSEAGNIATIEVEYSRSTQTVSGYANLGAAILNDASKEWMR